MSNFLTTTDYIIILLFLFIILLIGAKTGNKIKTFADYTKAYRSSKVGILGISLSMVIFGSGSLLGVFDQTQKAGIIYAFASLGYIINSLITAKYIVPLIDNRFNDMITVCDLFKYFYGFIGEKAAATIAIIFDICAASTGFIVLGLLSKHVFHINYSTGVYISAIFSIFYSSLGGIRAITILDTIKCTMLLIFIPILANISVISAGGFPYVLTHTSQNYFDIINHQDFTNYCLLFFFFMLPTHMLQPIVMQRILLIQNPTISKNSLYAYTLVRAALLWMVVAIALSALISYPNNNFFEVTTKVLPPILNGLTIVTIFIIILSKVDAHLNSSGIIVVKNLLNNIPDFNTLKYSRLSTLLIGLMASIIAVFEFSVVNIIVFIETLWGTIIGIPLLAGILGVQLVRKYFFTFLLLSICSFTLYYFFHLYSASLIIIGQSFLIFVSLFLLQTINLNLLIPSLYKYPYLIQQHYSSYKKRLFSIFNTHHFTYNNHKICNIDYFAFSIFIGINFSFAFFMWDFTQKHVMKVVVLRIVVILLSLLLLLKPLWPPFLKKYFYLYWHLTLLITLPFSSLFILIVEKWCIICLINSILSIFLLSLLTSWRAFITLLSLGNLFAFAFYYIFVDHDVFSRDIYLNYIFLYSYFFSILIVLIFKRRSQNLISRELYLSKLLGGTIAHELRTYLLTIKNYSRANNLSINQMNTATFHINNTLDKAFSFIDTLLTNIQGPKKTNNFSQISISDCLDYAISTYPSSKHHRNLIHKNIELDFIFIGNKEMIAHVIFNLLNNSLYYAPSRDNLSIIISTKKASMYNYILFRDNGPGITESKINKIFNKFYTSDKEGSGLGLSFCKISMHLLGGDITCNSKKNSYTEFILKFPKV